MTVVADQNVDSSGVAPPKMVATNAQMEDAFVPVEYRDYCAHHFIKWQECLRAKLVHTRCHNDEVKWEQCEYNEMKRAYRKRDLERVQAAEGGAQE